MIVNACSLIPNPGPSLVYLSFVRGMEYHFVDMSAPIPSTATDPSPEVVASLKAKIVELEGRVARLTVDNTVFNALNTRLQVANLAFVGRLQIVSEHNDQLNSGGDTVARELRRNVRELRLKNKNLIAENTRVAADNTRVAADNTRVAAENTLLIQFTQQLVVVNAELSAVVNTADGFMSLDGPSGA